MRFQNTLLISAAAALISSTSGAPIIKDKAINDMAIDDIAAKDDAQSLKFGLLPATYIDSEPPPSDSDVESPESQTRAAKYGPRPPGDLKMADGIIMFDLPECYQTCMRREDGKSSIHMGKAS